MMNLLDLDLQQFKQWMKENKESEFRAKQVFDWIYKNVWDFRDMKNIPKCTADKLVEAFYIDIPEAVEKYQSSDETVKFLLAYKDGNIIEAVVMEYKHGTSVCLSTQIGCRMGCTFCASTVEGKLRDLTSGEMLAQVLQIQKCIDHRISNIVLMGTGEPLDNYDHVLNFIKTVNAEYGVNIGQRHITLSTCGIVPKIIALADEKLQITLAISLHAPNDEIRKKMMPIAFQYAISDLIESCEYYIRQTNRRITFEYALVKGVNDQKQHARELSKLLRGLLCHVNLIPVNAARGPGIKRPAESEIEEFKNILLKEGIETTVRREMGTDINAACGQLKRSYHEKNK